jgi:hypothetical protein
MQVMKAVIRLSIPAELQALPILLRHSPAMVLPGGLYVVDISALTRLREASIAFQLLATDGRLPTATEVRI